MLLNSYEGFDYMDYSRYSMSTKDWGIVFIKSMAATVIIAYLFYDSPIVVIAFPAVFAYCAKLCRQEGVRRQKEKLNEEFMNVLKVLSSNMLAGYSVENAWQEAEKEMELMYGNDSLMLSEIREMNRQIKMNQTFEAVLSEFAHRSGLEDIVNFSDIFSFAKRSGGRFVDIIESKGVCEMLEKESEDAFDERRLLALKLGEEAGTKMLMPMMIMMAIVIAIVIAPAIIDFKI